MEKVMKNKIIALLCIFCLFTSNIVLVAQTEKNPISGIVTDESNNPIAGAIISYSEMSGYTVSDADGKFYIEVPGEVKVLKFESVGFKKESVSVRRGPGVMTVKLVSDLTGQDEDMYVGMDKTEKRYSYTGAISTISGDEIVKTPSVGLEQTLTGRFAGFTSIQSGSEPRNDGTIYYIRGLNSINGNSPLIVLDGVPAPTLDLNTLDPRTIEAVSILKDASAKALYGYRASSGVVLVTTKRGVIGKTQVNINLDFAMQSPTQKAETLGAYEYAVLRNQALINDGKSGFYSQRQLESFANGTGPDNNWYNEFMKSMTTMQRYNIDVNGGNNRVRYYVNGGFMKQDGLYKTQEQDKYDPSPYFDRFSVISNLDANLFDILTASLNVNARIDRMNGSRYGTSGILSGIYQTPATVEGPLTEDGKIITTEFINDPVYGRINRSGYNRETSTNLNISYGMDLDMDFLTKGLSLKGIVGYQSYYTGTIAGSANYTRYVKNEVGEYVPFGSNVDSPLSLSKSSNTCYSINFQGFLNYKRTFNKTHSIDAFLNYFAENRINTSFDASLILPYDRISMSGHLKYGYADKYFLQGDFSYCGSEQFGPGNRFGFFPAVSAAWVVSNENFLKDVKWFSYLKLRASLGMLGNDNISDKRFLYKSDIRQQNGSGYVSSLYSAALIKEYLIGNPNIRWEKSLQQNYGIDINLFNSVSLSVDYWRVNQSEMALQSESDLALQGVSLDNLPYKNMGKMQNQGIDIELSYKHKLACGLGIVANANMGYNKNKVTDIQELDRSSSGYYSPYRKTGYSIGQQFGYLVDYSNGNGYFNSREEIIARGLTYQGTLPRVGDFIYQDLNKDGVIDEGDRVPMANAITVPTVSYGASVQLDYKNFDFYLQLQGIAGSASYYNGCGIAENYGEGVYNNMHKRAWTPQRYAAGETITYPALTSSVSSSLVANDFFFSDNDYLRLKNVVIGYTLPRNVVNKLKISKLRIYLSGENLLTTSSLKFDKLDPETKSFDAYPIYRTFNIGINVNF